MHAAEQTGVPPKLVVHLSVSYDMHLTQNPIHKTRRTSSIGMTAGFNNGRPALQPTKRCLWVTGWQHIKDWRMKYASLRTVNNTLL